MTWKDKYGWLVEWLDKKREEARPELKRQKRRKLSRHNNIHRETTMVAVEPIKKALLDEKIEEPVVVALKLPVESNSPVKINSPVENVVVTSY